MSVSLLRAKLRHRAAKAYSRNRMAEHPIIQGQSEARRVGYANPAVGISACQSNSPPGCELKYGASVYHNVSAGYNIEPLNTRIDVGIDNLSDKEPAIIYQNNTLNGNVDANTFDTIGRFYWARVTVKF